MAKTPEGFLLCQNVPIARTGKQVYRAKELPDNNLPPDEMIWVYRNREEVFSEAAIASFEGKPVTNEHPTDMLNPQNIEGSIKGVAQNIRESGHFLVADLLIYDALLIAEIENGKREVSCGYNVEYAERNGRLCQVNIEGNHIAVVGRGRAGEKVSIRDESPVKTERRFTRMKKAKDTGMAGALAKLFPYFVKDSQPDELSEVVGELVATIKEEVQKAEGQKDETPSDEETETTPKTDSGGSAELCELLKNLITKIDGLCEKFDSTVPKADKNPLEKLEEELLEDSFEEEDVIADPEDINEQADGVLDKAGLVMPEYGKPKNPLSKEIKDAALEEIKKIKPIIAGIKDSKQRKMMTDSMAGLIRATYGLTPHKNSVRGGYSGIIDAQKSNAKALRDSEMKKRPNFKEISQKLEAERLGKK